MNQDTVLSADNGKKNQKNSVFHSLTNGRGVYLISFFVPLIIMIIIYIMKNIYPFGTACYLRSDMYHQYAPFFSELWHKLRTGGSLFYSWDIGLGSNFAAVFGYYLSSPTNWLIALFPQKAMIEVMNVIIILKIAASGFTFTYYLCKHTGKRHISSAIFGMFYALSAFVTAYSWCLMWLDCVLLLPLVILGLERLVHEGKGLLYSVALGFTILSNYYISIMVCLSLVIYFIVLMLSMPAGSGPQKYGRAILNFVIYSLIAGGISAVVLLPEIYALGYTASGDFSFPKTMTRYFSFITMMERHLLNVDVSLGLDHLPNIYCGVFVFLLLPLYIMNRQIPRREKVAKVLMLFAFFTAFNFNIPNFIWHGFHYPNSLPCRQSFIYIFVLLGVCYDAFINLKSAKISQISAVLWGVLIFLIFIGNTLTDDGQIDTSILYASAAFIAIYAYLFIMMKKNNFKNSYLFFALFAVAAIEVTVNTDTTGYSTTNRPNYLYDYDNVNTLLDKEIEDSDDVFYRTSKVRGYRSKNDAAWHNFKGASVFSSTAYASLTDLYGDLGLEHSTNAYAINGATPLVYSMFNIKYLLSDQKLDFDDLYTLVDSAGSEHLYRNNYVLPLGFMVPSSFGEWDSTSNPNPFIIQNELAYQAAGVSDLFTRITFEDNNTSATIVPEKDEYLYLYIMNKSIKTINISVDGGSENFTGINHGRMIDLGYVHEGSQIVVTQAYDKDSNGNESLQMYAYVMDSDKLKQVYENLSGQGLEVTSYDDTHVKGTVTADSDGLLFTSIPYDESFTVYVDGVETDYGYIGDKALISVPLSAGTHNIEFVYCPRGFTSGLFITIICVILVGGCVFFRIRFKKEITEPGAFDCIPKKAASGESSETAQTEDDAEPEEAPMQEEITEKVITEEPISPQDAGKEDE